MKKANKKKNVCAITRLWSTLEDMKKDLFIDLEKQEIKLIRNGKKIIPSINKRKLNLPLEKRHYFIEYKRVKLALHRLFFYWHNGFLPRLVDHKDTNPQNNKIENLRELDKSGNARNSRKIKKKTSSKYKGVCWDKRRKKWSATLTLNYKIIWLGYFNNEDDAGQAYNDKIRELGLEEVSVLNDTPQERARKNNQFDPLPQEINHIKVLFEDIEPLVDLK